MHKMDNLYLGLFFQVRQICTRGADKTLNCKLMNISRVSLAQITTTLNHSNNSLLKEKKVPPNMAPIRKHSKQQIEFKTSLNFVQQIVIKATMNLKIQQTHKEIFQNCWLDPISLKSTFLGLQLHTKVKEEHRVSRLGMEVKVPME